LHWIQQQVLAMQSLREDVPMTIAQILESHNWRRRKDLVNKVFTPDAVFWHPFFIVHGRHEILGIYQVRAWPRLLLVEPLLSAVRQPEDLLMQLWGANNFKINVTYDRVVPDSVNKLVVVDLLETVVSARPTCAVQKCRRHFAVPQSKLWSVDSSRPSSQASSCLCMYRYKPALIKYINTLQRLWWIPLTWVGIPMNFILHTVFDLEETSEGYIYKRQEVSPLPPSLHVNAYLHACIMMQSTCGHSMCASEDTVIMVSALMAAPENLF